MDGELKRLLFIKLSALLYDIKPDITTEEIIKFHNQLEYFLEYNGIRHH